MVNFYELIFGGKRLEKKMIGGFHPIKFVTDKGNWQYCHGLFEVLYNIHLFE
jgi:hypothetical protein